MATIVTRAGKGSPLTHTEVDANFTNLNDEAATKAPLASPALTGTPTAPTASVGTNTTQVATTAFVNAEIANDAPTKTGGGASGTWGISISGNAATATSATTASSATTADQIDGIGFRNTGSNSAVNADTLDSNGVTYYTAGVPNFTGNATDGALYSQAYSSSWQHQIAGDYRSGQIALRGKNNGTFQSWRTVLDSSNYTSYAPSLTGSGASGTWGINVTGSAGSVAWGNVSSKPSNIMYYQGFTLDANTMDSNSTGFTYSVNAPVTGPVARFSTGGGYDLWLNAPYSGGGNNLYFRTRNGDTNTLNSWRTVVNDANLTTYTAARNGSGYLIPDNWIQLNGFYGLYSGNNAAHFYPNNGSFGSWKVDGSRNGWAGLEFGTSGVSLMANSTQTGMHNNNAGWHYLWSSGTMYVFKNGSGGGTQATVLDSSNYTSYTSQNYQSGEFTAAANTGYNFSHGLGALPNRIDIVMRLTAAVGGWGAGTYFICDGNNMFYDGANPGVVTGFDSSNIRAQFGSDVRFLSTSGVRTVIPFGSCVFSVRAWR